MAPNPCQTGTSVNLIDPNVTPPPGSGTVELYTIYGTLLYSTSMSSYSVGLYMGNYPGNTTYVVKITVGSHVETHTLIKS
ncbi:T9SS type A sorting domain-containing protein [Flavobacterium silvaticum]|uniref:T9SS type A sorting domain-containing protein n=1 Tax=Flavobacterium silvaticum TaxID=1852020 RepID=A0A972FST3_9FLAO|nr:T9SS type A sorting domain-containing protein [Flavobacterium silvaticum]NMH28714.1 T9SS type A sorting domain-containing protein [Flavobacterium silvaticum]